ncbi:MAG: NAD(+)/NADH kinase [Desulfobacterales bacterium]|nr:NAD(+)/NADH kinase [Desulfobacterales bacterium]
MAKNIGLVVKPDPHARRHADDLEQWLKAKGHGVVRRPSDADSPTASRSGHEAAPADLSFVLVLGGDGTLLSAVRWLGDNQVPILGIKFGELGFLAEAGEEQIHMAVQAILDNQFASWPRMRLDVEVWRAGERLAHEIVFNDVVINKGALARLALIKTLVDDHYLTDYRADGLIVATPTGSTAYSLAAGGPIMHPAVAGILLTPICPFTLTNRPMIVPESSRIKIQLAERSADIMLTFDGQVGLPIDETHTILVRKADRPVNLITLPERNFFDVLRTKLKWSGSR